MAAPRASPDVRKKAMAVPAVSASCGATFLFRNKTTTKKHEDTVSANVQRRVVGNEGVRICLLGPIAHAEAGQVSVREGEEDHEDDEPSIVLKEDRQVAPGLHIAEHEERNEQQASQHEDRQQAAVLPWLEAKQ